MHGLTVRWSLVDAPPGTLDVLRDYVQDESHARFEGLEGLRFKTWRAREGEWFEGSYVFESEEARAGFQAEFEKIAETAAGTTIIGSPPITIEPCEIVAVAQGPAGFRSSSRFEREEPGA